MLKIYELELTLSQKGKYQLCLTVLGVHQQIVDLGRSSVKSKEVNPF
jgi:hypothetical protein